jgi:hypothetical protein
MKKEEHSLTVNMLVIDVEWIDHYIYKFWNTFHLLSSAMRKCLLPMYLKDAFLITPVKVHPV